MITWWNGTIFINTVFAIWTFFFIFSTTNNTFFRNAFVAWSTISIYWTSLGHADSIPTLIFIWAAIIVFTTLETFLILAYTIFATLNIFLAISSWILNISFNHSRAPNSRRAGKKVGPGKLGKNNKCRALNTCRVSEF